MRNSLITAVIAGAIVTVLSALVAYITVKTKARGRGLLDGLATVPLAVPSVVMGVGILYWYLTAPLPFHLYGTLTILVIAFVTIGLPYGMRYIVPGMAQIKDELEEAAAASGASWLRTFRRIYVPLLVPVAAGGVPLHGDRRVPGDLGGDLPLHPGHPGGVGDDLPGVVQRQLSHRGRTGRRSSSSSSP